MRRNLSYRIDTRNVIKWVKNVQLFGKCVYECQMGMNLKQCFYMYKKETTYQSMFQSMFSSWIFSNEIFSSFSVFSSVSCSDAVDCNLDGFTCAQSTNQSLIIEAGTCVEGQKVDVTIESPEGQLHDHFTSNL
jgi:hypothetical protein